MITINAVITFGGLIILLCWLLVTYHRGKKILEEVKRFRKEQKKKQEEQERELLEMAEEMLYIQEQFSKSLGLLNNREKGVKYGDIKTCINDSTADCLSRYSVDSVGGIHDSESQST